ncbi:hypothetical protein [Candidatus Albibeggiatoa sp. nov. NOAA]|uniref:hypothetical protein n=1 Tax=Candidatus Albibeggiatoa sp. nov. NOAA TaxID=3162724 RepID=UPI0033055713|nr:hypothetical protein [Thiotrichaceae bacterium]
MLALFEEIKKLKLKLAELEVEQERQDEELHQRIKDFEEISRLEAELLGIDHEELKQKVLDNIAFIRDTEEETEKLETELSEADRIALQQANKNEPMIHDDEETRRLEQELEELGTPNIQQNEHYFTICLVSADGNYSEWSDESGGGWHSVGLGHQYVSREEALQQCGKIQQRFPNYHIQVIEKP